MQRVQTIFIPASTCDGHLSNIAIEQGVHNFPCLFSIVSFRFVEVILPGFNIETLARRAEFLWYQPAAISAFNCLASKLQGLVEEAIELRAIAIIHKAEVHPTEVAMDHLHTVIAPVLLLISDNMTTMTWETLIEPLFIQCFPR